jgi:Domain of unknown function (DUF4372)
MDFLPWKYDGDYRTRSLSCTEQFRVMALAQLTYRESLRDIEVCLAARAGSFTTWASAQRWLARRWPMLTRRVTGASTSSWLNG